MEQTYNKPVEHSDPFPGVGAIRNRMALAVFPIEDYGAADFQRGLGREGYCGTERFPSLLQNLL